MHGPNWPRLTLSISSTLDFGPQSRRNAYRVSTKEQSDSGNANVIFTSWVTIRIALVELVEVYRFENHHGLEMQTSRR